MTQFQFECPHCRECTTVDAGVRDLLLERGCITCGDAVEETAFRRPVRMHQD